MLDPLRLALSTLTRVPGGGASYAESDFKNSFLWFPAVGSLIGLAVCAVAWTGRWAGFNDGVTAFFMLMLSVLLTGGLHLDGLSDTADAFFSGKGRDEMLRIMKESSSGPFGNAAVTLALIGKYAAIVHLLGSGRELSVMAAFVFSRWAMAAVSYDARYPRAGGTGLMFIGKATPGVLFSALILASAIAWPFAGWRILAAFGAATACVLLMRMMADKKIGGVTGDVLGATNETAELAALLAL